MRSPESDHSPSQPNEPNDRSKSRRSRHKRRQQPLPSELYAALDLGTNNCRLLVAAPGENESKDLRVYDSYSRIVRLGEGLSDTEKLNEEAVDRTLKALQTCKRKLDKFSLTQGRFVATEACRRAENADWFLERVREQVGIDIDIISSEEEARLAFLGCSSLLHKDTRFALAFDIGGGSTEFLWVRIDPDQPISSHKRHLIQDWLSLPYGVMNMSERFGGAAFTEMYFDEIVDQIAQKLLPMDRANGISTQIRDNKVQVLSTSGTVTTLAAIHLNLKHYDRSKIDGLKMSIEDARKATDSLMQMTPTERATHPCIGSARTDFILSGCAIFEAIARVWPVEHITIADRGVREGIIVSLMREYHG